MLQASRSGLFELYLVTVVEGDCLHRSRECSQLVGLYHSLVELNEAADKAAAKCEWASFDLRYPESFCRVYNTRAKRLWERSVASATVDMVPF